MRQSFKGRDRRGAAAAGGGWDGWMDGSLLLQMDGHLLGAPLFCLHRPIESSSVGQPPVRQSNKCFQTCTRPLSIILLSFQVKHCRQGSAEI